MCQFRVWHTIYDTFALYYLHNYKSLLKSQLKRGRMVHLFFLYWSSFISFTQVYTTKTGTTYKSELRFTDITTSEFGLYWADLTGLPSQNASHKVHSKTFYLTTKISKSSNILTPLKVTRFHPFEAAK